MNTKHLKTFKVPLPTLTPLNKRICKKTPTRGPLSINSRLRDIINTLARRAFPKAREYYKRFNLGPVPLEVNLSERSVGMEEVQKISLVVSTLLSSNRPLLEAIEGSQHKQLFFSFIYNYLLERSQKIFANEVERDDFHILSEKTLAAAQNTELMKNILLAKEGSLEFKCIQELCSVADSRNLETFLDNYDGTINPDSSFGLKSYHTFSLLMDERILNGTLAKYINEHPTEFYQDLGHPISILIKVFYSEEILEAQKQIEATIMQYAYFIDVGLVFGSKEWFTYYYESHLLPAFQELLVSTILNKTKVS